MRGIRRLAVLLTACAIFSVIAADAQEEPSLGDVARQTRQQKQQQEAQAAKDSNKDAAKPGNPAAPDSSPTAEPTKPAKRVITNDEIPEHIGPTRTYASYPQPPGPNYQQPQYKAPADYLKEQILAQKQAIARQEEEIERAESSMPAGNCVTNCVQWYEQQRQKQEQLERMKTMLEQMKKQLEAVQELARKAGYGSSVYDP